MKPEQQRRWKSFAQWPEGTVLNFRNRTEGIHDTKEDAEEICGELETKGYQGKCRVFPLETWTEEDEA